MLGLEVFAFLLMVQVSVLGCSSCLVEVEVAAVDVDVASEAGLEDGT